MSDRIAEFGYAAGWRVVRALPEPVAAALFRAGADLATRRGGGGVARLTANLRRVVGPDMSDEELAALARTAVRSYARYWMEAFRLPSRSPAQLLSGFSLEGGHWLKADVASGRGAIVALPHAGNWDAAGAWVVASGMPLTTVAERLRPEGLYERFLEYRERLGMHIVPVNGGARPPIDILAERLREAHVVALLAERDLSARGVEVTFFGGRTRMPAGPAILALRTGAPLYTTTMWYEPDQPRGRLAGPLPVPTEGTMAERIAVLTQRVADGLAAGIAEHPADWHMLQRLWLDDLPQRTR